MRKKGGGLEEGEVWKRQKRSDRKFKSGLDEVERSDWVEEERGR